MEPVKKAVCELCGEPMPLGEEMFKYHGYSGPCPKPSLPRVTAAPPSPEGKPPAVAKWVEWLRKEARRLGFGQRRIARTLLEQVANAIENDDTRCQIESDDTPSPEGPVAWLYETFSDGAAGMEVSHPGKAGAFAVYAIPPDARREEREAIVAWLRDLARRTYRPTLNDLAASIERGEHLALPALGEKRETGVI